MFIGEVKDLERPTEIEGDKVEGLTLLNFKPYYKAKVMKTVYY